MESNKNVNKNVNLLSDAGKYTIYFYIGICGLFSLMMTFITYDKYFNKESKYKDNKFLYLIITLLSYVFLYYIYKYRDNEYLKQFSALQILS